MSYSTTSLYPDANATEAVIIQIDSKIRLACHATSHRVPCQRDTTYHTLVCILIETFVGGGLKIKRVNDGTEVMVEDVYLGIICIGMVVEFLSEHSLMEKV